MLRCTVLRAAVGVLAVVLSVAAPNLARGQQLDEEPIRFTSTELPTLDTWRQQLDEEPILTVPEGVCDVEITPDAVDLLLADPLGFYAAYMVPVPCEPPPAQFKCQGCNPKSGVVYECLHFTRDPREQCDTKRCIKNVLKARSCYVSNQGAEDCRVLFDYGGSTNAEDNHIVQYVVEATPSCNTGSQEPVIWMNVWAGCPLCNEIPIWIRCKTSPERCRGRVIRTVVRRGRYICSPNPCPL
jgi:hypothetical protein